MFRLSGRSLWIAVFTVASLTFSVEQASCADATTRNGSLPVAIDTLANSIKDYVNGGKEPVGLLKVEEFRMPGRFKTSAGKNLRDQMTEALKKRNVRIDNTDFGDPSHAIEGTCIVAETDSEVVLKLTVSLVRTNRNTEVVGFRDEVKAVEVSDREAIAQTLGTTFDVALNAKPKTNTEVEQVAAARDAKFNESVKNPTVTIASAGQIAAATAATTSAAGTATATTAATVTNGQLAAAGPGAAAAGPGAAAPGQAAAGTGQVQTLIAPSLSSKFRIEIVVKNANDQLVPYPAKNANGLAVVELDPQNVFGVRIYNDFDFDVAVRLTLDGINCFALSSNANYRNQGVWIIPARSSANPGGGSATVTGWHVTDGDIKVFKVTEYPDSVAKQLGGPAEGIGVIQAQFFPAWGPGEPQPIQEQRAKADIGPLAIGAGPVIKSVSTPVTRFIGKTLLGAITVRYSRPDPQDLPKDGPPK